MHSQALARLTAISHNRLNEVASRMAEHYKLQASADQLRSIIYAVKKSDVQRLRQTEAIIALLEEIATIQGIDVGKTEITSDEMESIPDAGNDSEPIILEAPKPTRKPKADKIEIDGEEIDTSFVNDAAPPDQHTKLKEIKADPRPKPSKD